MIILITGATRGIGKETAKKFLEENNTVILQGRNQEVLDVVKREFEDSDLKNVYTACYDVRDVDKIKKTFNWIKKEFGRLDVLVNNAGVLEDALLGMISEEQIEDTLAINTVALINHMQYATRVMKKSGGSIINLTSIIGRVGNIGQTVYSASKAAVIGATYSAAKELAPHNIRVNAVAPGFIDTDMTKQLPSSKYNERLNEIKMKRIGTPREVANVIWFLGSPLSTYVTGQVIGVDGGMLV